jgi:error-prone DNA polymerase
MTGGYVELQVTTNYSFLRGASHPAEFAGQAAALGHPAIAVTDRNTLAGVVRAHAGAKGAGIRLVVGCRLDLDDHPSVLCLPTDRAAYGRLSRLLTLGKLRAPKDECRLTAADLSAHAEGQILIMLPPERPEAGFAEALKALAARHPGQIHLAGQHLYRGDDRRRLAGLAALAAMAQTPLVATNDVHYHAAERRILQDVVTCIREGVTIEAAGRLLLANAERHLKSPAEMARLFRHHPDAVARTVDLAERCRFSLSELKYSYPDECGPGGRTAQQELAHRTAAALAARHGDAVPPKLRKQIESELGLIEELGYAPYFLTVHDIVSFARSKDILCQGRGSAANSAVCYVLGITAVDPAQGNLLFERFISQARDEPPDIDVDFEHERREEVIQHVYRTYGRDRAAMTAAVSSYHMRGAMRDVGKVMGLSADVLGALARTVWGVSSEDIEESHVREVGLDPTDRRLALTLALAQQLVGFPRHLSQHVGGLVITQGPLAELVPIANAAMIDRTVIEWDKDDLDELHILKVDILALGMLTCIRKGFDLVRRHYGVDLALETIPQEVPGVYDMLCRADAIGVFQVESRAQMSMLPRLKPRTFYDLVIEVAIVRPGPIQGDMVHPYLRRRGGKEQPDYPSEELQQVLEKTLGVPLFQEQAMKIAIVAAGFTPSEADELRRAMATFKKGGVIHKFRDKMIEGMVVRNYDRDFATRCFKQIEGFGTYGFPESHAASFALLVYVSAWLKWRYPDVFACALLNSQPMGFYQPAQIVRDARDHGVEVRPVDVNHSAWDCTLESVEGSTGEGSAGRCALRLGLRQVKGLAETAAAQLVERRGLGYPNAADLARRSGLNRATLEILARADAFRSMALDRRAALWTMKGLGEPALPLFAAAPEPAASEPVAPEPEISLPVMALGQHVLEDYSSIGFTLKRHPVAFLRAALGRQGAVPAERLAAIPAGRAVAVAGLVLIRQRPGTAKGTIFMTLEDETGIANIIVWPAIFEQFRSIVMTARLVGVRGVLQKEGLEKEGMVIHIVARSVTDLSRHLARLDPAMRPGMHTAASPLAVPYARADEIMHPGNDQRPLRLKSRDFH